MPPTAPRWRLLPSPGWRRGRVVRGSLRTLLREFTGTTGDGNPLVAVFLGRFVPCGDEADLLIEDFGFGFQSGFLGISSGLLCGTAFALCQQVGCHFCKFCKRRVFGAEVAACP